LKNKANPKNLTLSSIILKCSKCPFLGKRLTVSCDSCGKILMTKYRTRDNLVTSITKD
jgi:hypothetical protein